MRSALIAAAAAAGFYGLHRLAVWAERRGWIYYREHRGSSGTLGSALLDVHALLEPSRRHVVEERRRDVAPPERSGDPPERAGSDEGGR